MLKNLLKALYLLQEALGLKVLRCQHCGGNEIYSEHQAQERICVSCLYADDDAVQCESAGCGTFWPQDMLSEVGHCPDCEAKHSIAMEELF